MTELEVEDPAAFKNQLCSGNCSTDWDQQSSRKIPSIGRHCILVDADYKFIWDDVGFNGAASAAQIFADSELKEAIENDHK